MNKISFLVSIWSQGIFEIKTETFFSHFTVNTNSKNFNDSNPYLANSNNFRIHLTLQKQLIINLKS